ncbi:MAG TPA: hypothetical protein VFK96_05890 [Gammaproteobacteria bacterium]|jgi:hypothetical protein|nr:hypothetical protein [Gammaproteobacteria bacterium]
MKEFLAWLMRSRAARVGMAALLGLVRIFGPFSGGVIALVVLRHGWLEGLLTTLAASLVLGAVEIGLIHSGLFLLTLPTLLLWWMIIGLALVLRRTASLALMVQVATVLGCLGVTAFFLVNPDPLEFWVPLLKVVLQPAIKALPAIPPEQWAFTISDMAMRMTGMLAASLVMTTSLAVLCGRWGQAVLYNPGGFRESFYRLRMGWPATIAASAIFVLSALVGNGLFGNLSIVLLIMFAYQGLAVIHSVVAYKRLNVGWLVVLYVLLLSMVMTLYVLAIVAGLGLIDNWFDIRARMARQRA